MIRWIRGHTFAGPHILDRLASKRLAGNGPSRTQETDEQDADCDRDEDQAERQRREEQLDWADGRPRRRLRQPQDPVGFDRVGTGQRSEGQADDCPREARASSRHPPQAASPEHDRDQLDGLDEKRGKFHLEEHGPLTALANANNARNEQSRQGSEGAEGAV